MKVETAVGLKPNPNIPELAAGDRLRVSTKIIEGEKQRTQVLEGVVIRLRRGGAGASFTIRRVSYGIGVERTFPLHSPLLEKVEVMGHGKVRRAKLYYLRGRSGRASRLKERRVEKEKAPAPQQEETTSPE